MSNGSFAHDGLQSHLIDLPAKQEAVGKHNAASQRSWVEMPQRHQARWIYRQQPSLLHYGSNTTGSPSDRLQRLKHRTHAATCMHTLQAYQQEKIHAAMEEANTKPAALETSANGAPGVEKTLHLDLNCLHTMQAYQQEKIHAAMEEANTKPGVKAVPAALETSANGAPGAGGASKGGMIVGDVHSYRSRKGMLSLREALVDVLLPIIVLLIGAYLGCPCSCPSLCYSLVLTLTVPSFKTLARPDVGSACCAAVCQTGCCPILAGKAMGAPIHCQGVQG